MESEDGNDVTFSGSDEVTHLVQIVISQEYIF